MREIKNFNRLESDQTYRVAHLFEPLSHNLSIAAVLEGKSRGWVYCDHPTQPRNAFIGTMEGYFIAGDAANPSFNSGARERIQQMIAGDTVRPDIRYVEFEFSGTDWITQLEPLFNGREPLIYLARHYLCTKLALNNWKVRVPSNLQVHSIGRELLQNTDLDLGEGRDRQFHPYKWAMGFGSISDYLTHGFGFAVMSEDQMVSWSMSDCVANNQAEIGIYTLPEYQRQGLGTIAAAAAVEYCLNSGMESVGWHCNDGNIPSQRVAEKVGFEYQKTRPRYYLVRPDWRHLAELGLRDFHNDDYHNCVNRYQTAFSLTDQAENYIYHLAAMAAAKIDDLEQAIVWLEEAAGRGWKNLSYTESRTEFKALKKLPEWRKINRMIIENEEKKA